MFDLLRASTTCLLWVFLLSLSLHAEEDDETPSKELTIERIFDSKDFDLKAYSVRWLEDGSAYLRVIKSAETKTGKDIVLTDPETGETSILVAAQDLIPPRRSAPLTIDGYTFSEDQSKVLIYTNSKKVWRRKSRGDYWVLDLSSLELRQLGGDATPSTLMHAKFSPDGRQVAYVRQGDLYRETLRSGEAVALTDSGSPEMINGAFDWVYEEEFRLQDGWRWSPDSRSIAFWQCDSQGVKKHPLIDYTNGLYPDIRWIPYPKTGELNSATRIGVVDVATRDIRWMDIPGDPREHYLHFMEWPKESDGIVVQQLNRRQNKNILMIVDPETGSSRPLLEESNETWVDVSTRNRWIASGKVFPWISEEDGWRHLYSINLKDGHRKKLFEEAFDIISLDMFVEETGELYFTASPENATQRYLYSVNINGKGLKRITPQDHSGTHSYSISPNGKWAIHTGSASDVPPKIDLVQLPDHTLARSLEENEKLHKAIEALELPNVEFTAIAPPDSVEFDAWILHPPNFDPEKSYPLIIYVYGEPAGQTTRDVWSGKRMLWHRFLAEKGFVVASIDNRGTPTPKGRDWRKSIYGQVGILASQDQAAAVNQLLSDRAYLDAKRVGVWGWSGGGSMTLNGLFRYPELYRAGISVAPVPNMRLYDTIYQERYMGFPSENPSGYRNGSPLHLAHQLEGNLLLIHGTGDDNVHYQGFEALVDRLVHHNKPFEMMAYPNRSHGISEGQNTSLHMYHKMWDFWQRNLLEAVK